MTNFNTPEHIGMSNAEAGWDQRLDDFEGLTEEDHLDNHRENAKQTAIGNKVSWEDAARAFDARIKELSQQGAAK